MTDIQELFSRDPLQLTDLDLDAMIAHMRENRKAFKLGNMTAGKMPTAKQKEALSLADALDIKLDL